MELETQGNSGDQVQVENTQPVNDVGTIPQGQSTEPVGNKPNDPMFMQADYTRKMQEIADMRRQVEQERQILELQRSQYQQPQYQQPQVTQQSQYQQLVDNFGTEAANALWQQQQQVFQQNQTTQLELYKLQEEIKGRQKYGESWDKHNYTDPMTGQVRNKVMDIRMSVNPITGSTLTLDQAFAAAEISDVGSYRTQTEQQLRDKITQEILAKKSAVPAQNVAQPRASSTGTANSVREAVEQALSEKGINLS